MRKLDCFSLALFAVSLTGVQQVMLIYGVFLFNVRDILVLIIGEFLIGCTSGGEVRMCTLEMSPISELYNLGFNLYIRFMDNKVFARKTGLEQ